jgi:hypothetical protein
MSVARSSQNALCSVNAIAFVLQGRDTCDTPLTRRDDHPSRRGASREGRGCHGSAMRSAALTAVMVGPETAPAALVSSSWYSWTKSSTST